MQFNATNWYWIVAGSTTQVFSSASESYVATTDAAYVAWIADGNFPTVIDSEDSLIDVLASAAPSVVVPSKAGLQTYANIAQWAKATGGYTVTIGGQSVAFKTDETSISLMTGKAVRLQQPNAPTTVQWQTTPSTFVQITAADFMTAATEVADFMQRTFDVLQGTILPGIASGSITSREQVDAAFM